MNYAELERFQSEIEKNIFICCKYIIISFEKIKL